MSALPSASRHKTAKPSLDDELSANGLTRYALQPPSWRAPWLNGTDNLGYPQFYPTSEGQEEDRITDRVVKYGFSSRLVVQTEAFSAHQLIYERLKSDQMLPALSRLATEVAERSASRAPTYGPAAFRLPQRLTVNDTKREAWVADLVNPEVPLSKLARTIPHGFRGQKITDMLCSRQVPIERAVWFVRAVGACEIAASKSKPGFGVHQYTRDWTTVVQEAVRKQLADISVPSEAESESSAKGKRVLVDDNLRAGWAARFEYTLRLVQAIYDEHLIDRELFLHFLIDQMSTANIAQVPIVVVLCEDYLAEFLVSEPLSAQLALACLRRRDELLRTENPHLDETRETIASLIRAVFVALPDAFIACPLWRVFGAQVKAIMLAASPADACLSETIRRDLINLDARNEAASEGTQDAASIEPDELQMIQILDDIAFPADLSVVNRNLFHKRRRRQSLLSDLNILFSWATTSYRYGCHRVFAVATLIRLELDEPSSAHTKIIDVESCFIRWVDAGLFDDRRAVGHLLAELIRVGVLSYSKYLQRMIARGETEKSEHQPPSVHLQLLRTVPIHGEGGQLSAKRRVTLLAGARSRHISKLLAEDAIRALEQAVPALTTNASVAAEINYGALMECVDRLAEDGSQFVLTREFIPLCVLRCTRGVHASLAPVVLSVLDHAVLIQIFLTVQDLWGLLEYLIIVLRSTPSREVIVHVLDIVETYLLTWTSMGALAQLAQALLFAHEQLKASGTHERRLVAMLRKLAGAGYIDQSTAAQIEYDAQSMILSLSTSRPQALLVAGMPEVQGLAIDSSPQAIAQLATTVWYRYHAHENWGQVALEAAIRSMPQVPVATIASFLREINERLPSGIETCVSRWIGSMSATSLAQIFDGLLGPAIATLLAELVLDGTISAMTAISSVVLPSWRALLSALSSTSMACATRAPADDKPAQLKGLEIVSAIFGSLIGCDPSRSSADSRADFVFRQRADGRRAKLYTAIALPDIGRCIALLAMQQEVWTARAEDDKAEAASRLIMHMSSGPSFKMAVARDPQALATAMLDSPEITAIPVAKASRPKLLAALLIILKDSNKATPASLVSTEDWDMFLSGLTIWRLAVSRVEVQACLERLELETSLQDSDKTQALHTLASHFLDRVCYGEGHMYLGEQVVKCFHGKASDELVSVAFSRLAEAVDGLAFTTSPALRASSLTTVRCSTRLLDILLQSGSATSRTEPLEQVLTAIKSAIENMLETGATPQKDVILHLALLLRLATRCAPENPLDQNKTAMPSQLQKSGWLSLVRNCLVPIGRMASFLSRDESNHAELGEILLDICAHIIIKLSVTAPALRLPLLHDMATSSTDMDDLPYATCARLTRLFEPPWSSPPSINPWELLDHADPGAPTGETRYNAGPIDLSLFDAKFITMVPPMTALDVPAHSQTTSNAGPMERGLQTNFDSETPTTILSLSARDYRRTLASGKVYQSTYDPAGKQKAREAEARATAATGSTSLQAAKVGAEEEKGKASSKVAATASTSDATGVARLGKRKDLPSQEVIEILSSSDEEALARAPAPKKAKSSSTSKSTAKAATKRKAKA